MALGRIVDFCQIFEFAVIADSQIFVELTGQICVIYTGFHLPRSRAITQKVLYVFPLYLLDALHLPSALLLSSFRVLGVKSFERRTSAFSVI